MKNTFGNSVSITVFGESHGIAIGVVLDGMAPGIPVDEESIKKELELRRAPGPLSTTRGEPDNFIIQSGVVNGITTGTPICISIPNITQRSTDYSALYGKARPGHADYTAYMKYHGHEDARGGGHFSGRITAGIVAAGAIAKNALHSKGIRIATHISSCAGIHDRDFDPVNTINDIEALSSMDFPVLDPNASDAMKAAILEAKADGDSVGGTLDTIVTGLPAGLGEPWFDSVESLISHALFSIPAIKGVQFGDGFALAGMRGSQANDPFRTDGERIYTLSNHNGGINGGITNGMPLRFECAVKPTSSIFKSQESVDFVKGENISFTVKGRHDPCIVHRARVVVEAVSALVLCDIIASRYGTDALSPARKDF